MSNLEEIIKQHANMSAYMEDMAELTRVFESFVYDSFNVKSTAKEISEVTVYTKDSQGKLQSEDRDWFTKTDTKSFINNMIPFLAYIPAISETKDGKLAEKVMITMSESALADSVFKNYFSAIVRDKLTEHKRIENSAQNTGTDLEGSIKATIDNISYQPGKAFENEIDYFLMEILPTQESIVKLIKAFKLTKPDANGKQVDFSYIFKKKIYDNVQKNYKSWEIFLRDIYGSATDKDMQANADKIVKEFYEAFRLPDNAEEVIGKAPDNLTDEDFGNSTETDSEDLANGLSADELSQWSQINKVWDALKDIKVGDKAFSDVLFEAFKKNEATLQEALTKYLRTVSPKDGLIFKKGWSQQITTKFIQVIIIACIDEVIFRGAYHNVNELPEEKLQTLVQKYQNAADHNNTDAMNKIKTQIQERFGVNALRKLDTIRPRSRA